MSKTKAGGSVDNVHDSAGRRLGVKRFGGEQVTAGEILVRQRGTAKIAGSGAAVGRDHTIFATRDGVVAFKKKKVTNFTGSKVRRTEVQVI